MSVYAIGDKETLSKENKTLSQINYSQFHWAYKVIMNI